jgi:hypothetical protein
VAHWRTATAIHDPELFGAPARLIDLFARHGVELRVGGLRPSLVDYLRLSDNTTTHRSTSSSGSPTCTLP